jgi:hypothetical protein
MNNFSKHLKLCSDAELTSVQGMQHLLEVMSSTMTLVFVPLWLADHACWILCVIRCELNNQIEVDIYVGHHISSDGCDVTSHPTVQNMIELLVNGVLQVWRPAFRYLPENVIRRHCPTSLRRVETRRRMPAANDSGVILLLNVLSLLSDVTRRDIDTYADIVPPCRQSVQLDPSAEQWRMLISQWIKLGRFAGVS